MTAAATGVVLLLFTLPVAVPLVVFSLECFAALLPPKRRRLLPPTRHLRTAIVIPAHDEERRIAGTLESLSGTLSGNDRVLVVADNCHDGTADVARQFGADAIERHDPGKRGKGQALAFGIRHLETDPPDVVIVIDADCRVDAALVAILSQRAHATQRPVQSLDLCEAPPDAPSPIHVVSALGVRFKNFVRPSGLARLGLPCQLMGTGMAIPWGVIQEAPITKDALVEDMQLGIDMAICGHPALFCPDVRVTSALPSRDRTFLIQRKRWEHGHLATAASQVPRLLREALRQRSPGLLALALDLLVPPFSLLAVVWLVTTLLFLVAGMSGATWMPATALGGCGALAAGAVCLGWLAYCRDTIPLSALLSAPLYVLRKLPIYASFLTRRQQEWETNEHGPEEPREPWL